MNRAFQILTLKEMMNSEQQLYQQKNKRLTDETPITKYSNKKKKDTKRSI